MLTEIKTLAKGGIFVLFQQKANKLAVLTITCSRPKKFMSRANWKLSKYSSSGIVTFDFKEIN
jgi:hypothetical protein